MGAIFMVPSPIIDAAIAILSDGKARTADEILAIGVKRGLFTADMTRKRVYTALSQYVERAAGRGRKARIIEDAQHRFMLNHAPDDWPGLDLTGLPALTDAVQLSPDVQSAIDALQRTEAQTDPTAFEVAVCDAFNHLGFVATHIGGNGQPDGYADALLGPLAYRIMIECKLSADIGDSHSAAAAEAAKFKDTYKGEYCILVAPSYEGEVTFASELQVHNVSAWTVDDLTQALKAGCNALEMRELLQAGFAEDALGRFPLGSRARAREAPTRHRVGRYSRGPSSAAFGPYVRGRLTGAPFYRGCRDERCRYVSRRKRYDCGVRTGGRASRVRVAYEPVRWPRGVAE